MEIDVAQDSVIRTRGIRESDVFEGNFPFEGEFAIADGFFCIARQSSECKDMVR